MTKKLEGLSRLRFKPLNKSFSKFCNFRCYDIGAIALIGIIFKVILVITFCRRIFFKSFNLSHNGLVKDILVAKFFDDLIRNKTLLLIFVIDTTAVLRTNIVPLLIKGSRIMCCKKYMQYILKGDDACIKLNS